MPNAPKQGANRRAPNDGKGRPPGIPNKINRAFKTAVLEVFEKNGGAEWMGRWAKENETEFFKIAARLIPTEVAGTIEHKQTLVDVLASLNERASERPAVAQERAACNGEVA
ncbi:MAG: hypothetical protein KJ011_05280 [Burkholderiaceae bacterium]|nr:hypothetical protein [Burkholderiaceae bacterium]